jgi:protein SCO1
MQRNLSLFLIFLVLAILFTPGVEAVQSTIAETSTQQDAENRDYFTDLKVITHEGEELRFYSDVLKDKLVLISFFYISCPTPLPALLTTFKLQKLLGEQLGKEVILLSISVDPENDTPEAVAEYAKKYNPQKGWLFLTGKRENMDAINKKLGNTLRLPEGHLRVLLLGNLKTGHWMRMIESAPVVAVREGLKSLASEQ